MDVSAGKTDMLYRAHGYHTKVPHRAIVPSILHYTKPGDVVLDGFCGSGMTGVAAQWCGTAPSTFRLDLEQQWRNEGRGTPEWGARRVILGDLSPAATFIAANYNLPFDVPAFSEAAAEAARRRWRPRSGGCTRRSIPTERRRVGSTIRCGARCFRVPSARARSCFVDEALDKETNACEHGISLPYIAR